MIFKKRFFKRLLKRITKLNNIFIFFILLLSRFIIFKLLTINLINDDLIHIFITRAFYYNYIILNETKYEKSLIVIFNAEKQIPIAQLGKDAACLIYSNNNKGGEPKYHKAYIEGIIGEKPDFECKISIYRLFCPQLSINKNENIENINIAIRLTLQSEPFHIKMQRADRKPKKFIACPSRLFAFDQWHLFITTLELFRLHQVNLVIVYIQSVETQVYNLIKAYESSGFVQIRPSLEMPSINTGLNYNPNSETSWQNQLTNFQDCLYEFKESSEFIAFPDWDDFFFTSDYSIPYYPILKKFSDQNPKVNTFIIDRYMGYHESLDDMHLNGHWMTDFWRQGIKYSTKDTQLFAGRLWGKAIYKPNRGLYGVDLHWANRVEPGYKEMRIPLKEAYIIHARDYSKYKLDGRINDTRPLELNFTTFVRRHRLSNLLNKLPKFEASTVELNKCLGLHSQGMQALVLKSESKCWNYHKCNIKIVRSDCFNVKNTWLKLRKNNLLVNILTQSNFKRETICTY